MLGAVSLISFGASPIGTYEIDPLAIAIFSILVALSGLTLDSRSQVHDPADSGSISKFVALIIFWACGNYQATRID